MTFKFGPLKPGNPWTKPPTPKQKRQQELAFALGTVMGFAGYLANLDRALKIIQGEGGVSPASVSNLRTTLKVYKQAARHQLAHLDEQFPK